MNNIFGTIVRSLKQSTNVFGKNFGHNLLKPVSVTVSIREKSSFPQFVNLPPSKLTGGTGNPFETKLHRKRTVVDPNLPNFEHIEKLHWSTWGMLRDVRRRHMFVKYIRERNCYVNLRSCRMLPYSIREVSNENLQGLTKHSSFKYMNSRCAITGRSRGVVKRYRLSRFIWRNLADYNKLSGVIKASW